MNENEESALTKLFGHAGLPVPPALADWELRTDRWCEDYYEEYAEVNLSEINLDLAVFVFDHSLERVILAYALSVEQLMKRDSSRMRGFPDVNVSVCKTLGDEAFTADRGHFLGHASGGKLDINLFPQRRELNRGWSVEGKQFRKMERYVAEHTGTFFYHRPIYCDQTWIPHSLEYGILRDNKVWWVDTFMNR
ncbi:MAG: DNA/RNA non-specific endonuclease [Gammaproteobacteria bacterium]|nr:DNA/RNA non-specific endonuclease [Gammaproteobacteria bacterium]